MARILALAVSIAEANRVELDTGMAQIALNAGYHVPRSSRQRPIRPLVRGAEENLVALSATPLRRCWQRLPLSSQSVPRRRSSH